MCFGSQLSKSHSWPKSYPLASLISFLRWHEGTLLLLNFRGRGVQQSTTLDGVFHLMMVMVFFLACEDSWGEVRRLILRKPVWPSGKAAWLVSRRTSVRSASVFLPLLFKNYGLWTRSCELAHTINETLKWLTQLPTLMQSHSGDDSVASRCEIQNFPTPQLPRL